MVRYISFDRAATFMVETWLAIKEYIYQFSMKNTIWNSEARMQEVSEILYMDQVLTLNMWDCSRVISKEEYTNLIKTLLSLMARFEKDR